MKDQVTVWLGGEMRNVDLAGLVEFRIVLIDDEGMRKITVTVKVKDLTEPPPGWAGDLDLPSAQVPPLSGEQLEAWIRSGQVGSMPEDEEPAIGEPYPRTPGEVENDPFAGS